MSAPIWIVATGARTPLGLSSASSAAAVRAEIGAARQHPFLVDQLGNAVIGAFDTLLDPGLQGSGRMLALARGAWDDLTLAVQECGAGGQSVPLYIALPEARPGFAREDAEAIEEGLRAFSNSEIEVSQVLALAQGNAAGISALNRASELIRGGEMHACVVGGIDSYLHADTLEWLDAHRQLAGEASRGGFVPGEGAGFCLLMSNEACQRCGITPSIQVLAGAVSHETQLINAPGPCLAKGLTDAVRQTVEAANMGTTLVEAIICDVNGERYRGEEWGFVCLRLGHHFADPTAYISPADTWGDMGAASGPLFAMLACQAAARGYARGHTTLLWAGSPGGLRASVMLGSTQAVKVLW